MAMFSDEAKDLVQFLGSVLCMHPPTPPPPPSKGEGRAGVDLGSVGPFMLSCSGSDWARHEDETDSGFSGYSFPRARSKGKKRILWE